jgi:hypothetical protein
MNTLKKTGNTFIIPKRTLAKLKIELEQKSRIEQALAASNNIVGSTLFSVIDVYGGTSEKLEDYVIDLEKGIITEKSIIPSAEEGDVEK